MFYYWFKSIQKLLVAACNLIRWYSHLKNIFVTLKCSHWSEGSRNVVSVALKSLLLVHKNKYACYHNMFSSVISFKYQYKHSITIYGSCIKKAFISPQWRFTRTPLLKMNTDSNITNSVYTCLIMPSIWGPIVKKHLTVRGGHFRPGNKNENPGTGHG